MQQTICPLCQTDVALPAETRAADDITGALCEDCRQRMSREPAETLGDYLDRFEIPIVMFDANVRAYVANASARETLGKDAADIKGHLGGEIIGCTHSKEPGGCGQTLHCQSCTIRNSVAETYATGLTLRNVHAYLDVQVGQEVQSVHLLITTEKAGDYVLLKMDTSPEQDG